MVSIIIPLHNLGLKGSYCLKRCLDSILAQKYDDFEVLLMENGSSDDTVEVAKTYCQKDNRFKLHILDTIGIANARNEGLKIAAGEYVSFIDGDDAISDNFLKNTNNISLFIIRYFGGIKLGKGGLYRAYSKCAIETLKQIKMI